MQKENQTLKIGSRVKVYRKEESGKIREILFGKILEFRYRIKSNEPIMALIEGFDTENDCGVREIFPTRAVRCYVE